MNNKIIEKHIRRLYRIFFKKLNIDPDSGILKHNKKRKFATYPFIGSKYIRNKILFVGLDIGKDEAPRNILGFQEKRKVEELNNKINKMNTHIAGVYISTIYFLKRKNWARIKNEKSYKAGVKKFKEKSRENLLSCVAFTNLHKFVTVGRKLRTGGADRKWEDKDIEEQLLLDEIMTFSPKIIIFQSVCKFRKQFLKKVCKQNKNSKIIVASHPSCRGLNKPRQYVSKFLD